MTGSTGRNWRTASAVVAVAVVAATLVRTGPAVGEPPRAPDGRPSDAEVHERYAAARLRLAELRLDKAEDLNRRTPGLLTETDMRRLRNRVEVLEAECVATKNRPHGNSLEAQVAAAKAMARIAEEDLEAAAAIHRRQPQAVSERDLRQFEVKAEIARLRAELWEDPSFRNSPIDVMQMQIDQMSDLLNDMVDAIDGAPAVNRR